MLQPTSYINPRPLPPVKNLIRLFLQNADFSKMCAILIRF